MELEDKRGRMQRSLQLGSLLGRALGRASAAQMRNVAGRRGISVTSVLRDSEGAKMDESEAFATLKGQPPQKVIDLSQQILSLNMIEVKELLDLLKEKLDIQDGGMMPMGMPMGMPAMPQPGAPAAAAAGAPAEDAAPEAKAEKTDFEIKLDSFNAADKLKVIKEVRAITGLGLKESKEMVEGAPQVVKAGVPKEDAEKFKKQIEDAGGKVTIS